MRKVVSGLLALAFIFASAQMSAFAGNDTVPYKPGLVKEALAKGETVLLHYKSTW